MMVPCDMGRTGVWHQKDYFLFYVAGRMEGMKEGRREEKGMQGKWCDDGWTGFSAAWSTDLKQEIPGKGDI